MVRSREFKLYIKYCDKVFEKISKWDSKGVLHDMFNGMQVQPIFRKI